MSFAIPRLILFLLFFFCIFTAQRCAADSQVFPCDDGFEIESFLDHRYGPTEGYIHKFDLFQPAGNVSEPRPLLILLHPGAFILGDKSDFLVQTIARDFARCGFVTASVNYRLITNMTDAETALETISEWEHPIKRQLYNAIRDVRTSIRFFKANAQAYHIDSNRIYLVGYSAGAVIALNIAYLNDAESGHFFSKNVVSDEGECLDCIPYYGETTPQKFDASVAGIVAINGALFDLSCVSDVDKTPVLFVYSDKDDVIQSGEGKPYQKFLDKKNVELNLPSIAFELGITKSTKAGEVERTTVHGINPSIILPKWIPKLAASSITPKVYGSKAILKQLNKKYRKFIEFKGGHNFIANPESGDLNANYEMLCTRTKSFFLSIDKKAQKNNPREHRRNRRGE